MNTQIDKFEEFELLCKQRKNAPQHTLDKNKPIWIFGAGNFGRDLAKILIDEKYNLLGFIETQPRLNQILGLPVLNWEQLSAENKKAQLAIGIFNRGMPLDRLHKLAEDSGFANIFMPWDIYEKYGESLGWRFWLSKPEVIFNSLPAIKQTYDLLADDVSKKCLLDILSFRLGLNTNYASFSHSENQYFNQLTLPLLKDKEVLYVDCGAYNGDTLSEISKEVDISEAWLFEPDAKNFSDLVKNVKEMKINATSIPCGVSDKYDILTFNGGGEGGAISESGSQRIVTVALDQILPVNKIDFLKLDIEGAEAPALRGGKELIKRSRPVIALSLYHLPKDPWELPALLQELCQDYSYFIRQHYFNSFDSVLYAVPDH
jgi:FkbM family methyltransferase